MQFSVDSQYLIKVYIKEAGTYGFQAERLLSKNSGNIGTVVGQYYKIEVIHLNPMFDKESVELEFKAGGIIGIV